MSERVPKRWHSESDADKLQQYAKVPPWAKPVELEDGTIFILMYPPPLASEAPNPEFEWSEDEEERP